MIALVMAAMAAGPGGHAPAPAQAPVAAAEVVVDDSRFAPARTVVLTGETVLWRNRSGRHHTITARGAFDSGSLPPGGEFARRFDTPGTYRYLCTIHRAMTGSVEVAALALQPPDRPVAAGSSAELTGRAPEGVGEVVLERAGAEVARAPVSEDGTFTFDVIADGPASYRARAGGLSSAAVAVPVAPHLTLTARRRGRRISVRVQAFPAQPGGRVVVERHRRERFGFVRARPRALRLGRHSRAHTTLRLRAAVRLRARLAIPALGWSRTISPEVTLRSATGDAPHHPHH